MPKSTNHKALNCVQSLFDTLIDISKGYRVLLERAEPSVLPFIKEIADQHTNDIVEIEHFASQTGFELDRSGTVMSEVHKAAVKLRDLFSDIDSDALKAVTEGEENVVKRYEDAINCMTGDDPFRSALIAQRNTLRSKIAKISEAV